MPGNEDLRFVLELKDEFTKVFDNAYKNMLKKTPKIIEELDKVIDKGEEAVDKTDKKAQKAKKALSPLSKTIKVIGAGLTIAGGVYASWQAFKQKVVDSQKAAEALEATLGNIVGSRGSAKKILNELADTDLSKVFKIDDINEGYKNLANAGLKATTAQLTHIGDLAANTGLSFNKTADLINGAVSGNLKGLKEMGISFDKIKDKKKGIDAIEFSFRGQKTTVKNTSEEIRKYLLGLGTMEGITGSMAGNLDTLAAADNRFRNELSKTWTLLAERWGPDVKRSRETLTKFVATVNSWIAIPTSQKIQDEVRHLEGLRAKLNYTNTSEDDRRKILQQIKRELPGVIDHTKSEREQLESLNGTLDQYIRKRRQQIALEKVKEHNITAVNRMDEILSKKSGLRGDIDAVVGEAVAMGLDVSGMSSGQAQMAARQFFETRIKTGQETGFKYKQIRDEITATSNESRALAKLNSAIAEGNKLDREGMRLMPEYERYQNTVAAIKKLLPGSESEIDRIAGESSSDGSGSGTSLDQGGIASVSGGGQIKNVTINIQNLVSGGVNVSTTTLKEGVSKAKDIVVEGLLTAVNDANLVGS